MKMTRDNANEVWPPALANTVTEHEFMREHQARENAPHAAERLDRDPRRRDLPAAPMLVEAVKDGVYELHRPRGARFTIRNGRTDFSFNWMKAVNAAVELEAPAREGLTLTEAGAAQNAPLVVYQRGDAIVMGPQTDSSSVL